MQLRISPNKYIQATCYLLFITTLLIILYALDNFNFPEFLRVSTVLILLQFAALAIGSLLGFIFGFPSYNSQHFDDKYHRNLSLKEITSWLTKIIVGVTLFEFKDLYKSIKEFVFNSAATLGSDNIHVFIISVIIILYFIVGFLTMFLLAITEIFAELAKSENDIAKIINDQSLDPNELYISPIIKKDFNTISEEDKSKIQKYIVQNDLNKLSHFELKRLAKFLLLMKEYTHAVKAYEISYKKDKSDSFQLLNACFIRSKYLKQFNESNDRLKALIKEKPQFAPAYYNLACNYNREYLEFKNAKEQLQVNNLRKHANKYLTHAFNIDEGLYSEAITDEALRGMDIANILNEAVKS